MFRLPEEEEEGPETRIGEVLELIAIPECVFTTYLIIKNQRTEQKYEQIKLTLDEPPGANSIIL